MLERNFEHSLHPYQRCGAVAISSRSTSHSALPRNIFAGFGSAYCHWNPNDRTLLWDRLPIALSFMAILAIIIEERVSTRAGALLLWLLLTLAVFSLLLWRWTDDLRLFFPFLAMLLILGVLPEIYRHISLDRRCV